jgi:glycogen debranching enzyme
LVELAQFDDQYYILATSSLADERTRVLKHGETFAVFDRHGDIQPIGLGEQGLYHEGTRFLSRLELRIGPVRPLLLSSTVKEDNVLLAVDLTNPDVHLDQRPLIPRGTLHIFRSKFLWDGSCFERLRIKNYGAAAVALNLSFEFDADFADIFEVRGTERAKRGERRDPVLLDQNGVLLQYVGLDRELRELRLECSPPPSQLCPNSMGLDIVLQPHEQTSFTLAATCRSQPVQSSTAGPVRPSVGYDLALENASRFLHATGERFCQVYTSNEAFNNWLSRSLSDLQMMITETSAGPYPDAGVPWFSTRFGRDGILTALEVLWINPQIAAGVLSYLAETQARDVVPEQDASPGKILHETRKGEMAALGEVPFGRYYGSVDSTPLFVILAGAYYERTADLPLIRKIWPNIELALSWIDTYGDLDQDGFVEYKRHSPKGLVHQGWKDSHDSVMHAGGAPAEGPIAICEMQGYVYAARLAAAQLAHALDQPQIAQKLTQQAEKLHEQFEQAFWCEEISTYALALDGRKRPCQVRASNAGHALFSGIASPHHARRAASTLTNADAFSGWGIRTLAATESAFNPMSYHNGSVWPHDNALIASGFARYGFQDLVLRVLSGLFDASLFAELHRLPELFCGFHRRPGEGPTLYPVACAPQSWAAASVFLLLQSALGLSIDARKGRIFFTHSLLPQFLQHIQITNLRVGDAAVDLSLTRHPRDVGINVKRKEGNVEVVAIK